MNTSSNRFWHSWGISLLAAFPCAMSSPVPEGSSNARGMFWLLGFKWGRDSDKPDVHATIGFWPAQQYKAPQTHVPQWLWVKFCLKLMNRFIIYWQGKCLELCLICGGQPRLWNIFPLCLLWVAKTLEKLFMPADLPFGPCFDMFVLRLAFASFYDFIIFYSLYPNDFCFSLLWMLPLMAKERYWNRCSGSLCRNKAHWV